MDKKRTLDEQIQEIIKKEERLKAQKRALRKRQSEEERRKRTKRLIEMGAIVESVLGRETTDEDKIKLENFLKKQESNGKYFSRDMNKEVQTNEETRLQ